MPTEMHWMVVPYLGKPGEHPDQKALKTPGCKKKTV